MPEATQLSDSVLEPPVRSVLMFTLLLAHPLRLSRADSNFRHVLYSVDSYIAHLAIYSFDFIALGSTLKYNCKHSTHPNVHSLCLIMRLLSGSIGEQQDDSSCEMRNLGKWDLIMDFSVTLVV